MKKIILFVSLCFPLLFSCCEVLEDGDYTSEYIYKNATAVPVNMSVRSIYSGNEYEKLQILPGQEARREYITPGDYTQPFYLRDLQYYVLLIVDNGSNQVASQKTKPKDDSFLMECTGLFCMESYELISESNGKRTYRFVFTDDYFKDGEPIENFPTE